jgi:tryptophan synthase beta chain
VMMHQTIIGLETKKQLAMFGIASPDVVIGCSGGGSNFAGLAFPFVRDKINGADIEIIPVEPASCPSLTKGRFVYDLGDKSGMTPLLPMFSLGHNFVPEPIHAGGLRYHGMSPLVSQAAVEGLVSPTALDQIECYEAALLFARTEGLIVAPETSHAVAAAIRSARQAKEEGKDKVIVFGLSGHGLLDLRGYQAYMAGELAVHALEQEVIDGNLAEIAHFPAAQRRSSGRWNPAN